jgi:16S rRNA (uracil1498-N3)-methyltransferase
VPWDEAVVAPAGGLLVVLWERARTGLLQALPTETPGEVALVVGPEGGIPDADVRAAQEQQGAVVVSVGPNVLRSETAAVAGAAVILARYGRLG